MISSLIWRYFCGLFRWVEKEYQLPVSRKLLPIKISDAGELPASGHRLPNIRSGHLGSPRGVQPFERVRAGIERSLLAEKRQHIRQAFEREMLESSDVRIHASFDETPRIETAATQPPGIEL